MLISFVLVSIFLSWSVHTTEFFERIAVTKYANLTSRLREFVDSLNGRTEHIVTTGMGWMVNSAELVSQRCGLRRIVRIVV